jgi:hypothetical protein
MIALMTIMVASKRLRRRAKGELPAVATAVAGPGRDKARASRASGDAPWIGAEDKPNSRKREGAAFQDSIDLGGG